MDKEQKIVQISGRDFEILNENRLTARVFEAVTARSGKIMEALDEAARKAYERREGLKENPTYTHTIFLGKDDNGKNLRASIAVFSNAVIVQTLREV